MVVTADGAFVALRHRRAAKLAGPHDERVIEHPALLEIGNERGAGLVDLLGAERQLLLQQTVVIPIAVVELDKTYAALRETAREQAVRGKRTVARRAAVECQGARVLAAQIRQLGHARLHLERHLILRDAGRDLGVVHEGVVLAVQRRDRLHVGTLLRTRNAAGIGEVVHGVAATVQLHTLKTARQEPAAPLPRRDRLRRATRARGHHHDKSRQIFRLTAEPVVHPCPHARTPRDLRAGVHEHVSRIVVDRVRRHRTNDTNLVHDGADVRKEGTDLRLIFPEFRERKLRRVTHESLPLQLGELLSARQTLRHRLAV